MGSPTLPNRTNGSIITSEWFNVFQRALSTVFVPRDSSGFAGDIVSSLGTTAYAWANAFVSAISLKSSLNFTTLKAPPTLPTDFTLKMLASLGAGKGNLYVDETGQLLADAANYALSGSSGTFSTTSTSDTQPTNLSASITTKGRPVMAVIVPDGSANYANFSAAGFNATKGIGHISLYRDGSLIASNQIQTGDYCSATVNDFSASFPFNAVFLDLAPSAGAHTYSIQVRNVTSSSPLFLQYVKLFVMELFG